MRQLTFVGPERLEWWDVPTPRVILGTDALVRPLAVARCDLDGFIVHGLYPLQPPFALGHEMVGEVLEIGSDVRSASPGDQVIVPFQVSCGLCARCTRGLTNACEQVPPGSAFGLGPHGEVDFGGALSDVVRVPYADAMLLPLPPGLGPIAASGVPDNVADGYRTVAPHLTAFPRAPVLVVGGLAASVGLYAVLAAIALGSDRVVYTDDDNERLAIAERFGAVVRRVDYSESPEVVEQFPITVDACVLPSGLGFALAATEPCGVCTSVSAGIGATAELPLRSMYLKGIRYEIGRVHARATAERVLELIADGDLDPAEVVSQVVPFGDAAEAMLEPAIKMVFSTEGAP